MITADREATKRAAAAPAEARSEGDESDEGGDGEGCRVTAA
jgi:hypothetical protein